MSTPTSVCVFLMHISGVFCAPPLQVNTVVSGALDRLHYEKDPCVKYDIGRKLWIYLHRSRSQEEFGEAPLFPVVLLCNNLAPEDVIK